jgi:hypothetical protein
MADHADDGDGDNIFVYRGGRVPQHITHVLIDRSIDEIEKYAFDGCRQLSQVDTHDGIRKIGSSAFYQCYSLRRINIESVVEIGYGAFNCESLESVEFGDRLETIGKNAFGGCSLKHLKLPSIIAIRQSAFSKCTSLIDVEISERLETIGRQAFWNCERLQRVAIPLKRDLFEFCEIFQRYDQFFGCAQLTTVDLVGGIHKTVASLQMESWRTKMIAEINRINHVLPNTHAREKTDEIQQWMEGIMDKMHHYKAAHCMYVREGITLLELALWKAKLGEKEDEDDKSAERQTKKAKVDSESARKERRITCGADIVIKNVLPFLQLE